MNALTKARLAGTVLAAGLMVVGFAPPAMTDPSTPPSAPGSDPPVPGEPCSALRKEIELSNDLDQHVVTRVPYLVRVPVTDPSTQTILVGSGALGGATLVGTGFVVWSRRRRGSPTQELFDEVPQTTRSTAAGEQEADERL